MQNGMGLTLNSMPMGMGSPMMSMESPIKKRKKKMDAMNMPKKSGMPGMSGVGQPQLPFGGILKG